MKHVRSLLTDAGEKRDTGASLLLLLVSADFGIILLHILMAVVARASYPCGIAGICDYVKICNSIKLFWVIILFFAVFTSTRSSGFLA